jgi:membrane protein DedA with SNARE-associated domain
MTSFLQHEILGQSPLFVLVVVGLVVFLEDAVFLGFVIPGEAAALLGGVVASRGDVPLWLVAAVVVGAAVTGDSVGYQVGRSFGPRVLDSRPLRDRRRRIDEARDYLRLKGGWAVLLGRWTAFFRAVIPGLAGMSRMPYRTFLVFNALGGVAWGVTFVLLGYFAGNAWTRVADIAGRAGPVFAGVVAAVVVGVLVLRHLRSERRHGEEAG